MNTPVNSSRTRNPLPWILVGAVLASILVYLLSFILADSELRNSLVLLLVPVLGAMAGWVVYALNPLGKPRGWRKSILLLVAVLVYTMAIIFGYAITQVGAF